MYVMSIRRWDESCRYLDVQLHLAYGCDRGKRRCPSPVNVSTELRD